MSDLTLKYVGDERERRPDEDGESIVERAKEVVRDLLDSLAELLAPPPRLVPVRVRQPARR